MITIGEWVFDPSSRRLLAGAEEHRLSPKAAKVLQALAETPRRIWSRDALLERVWPNVLVGEEVLTHAVTELRRAMGDDFRAPTYLETVYKMGYRLLCPVEGVAAEANAGAAPAIDLQHYVTYLEACELYERGGKANMKLAARLFSSLARAEPDYAPAQIGTAKALALLNIYYNPRVVDLDQALGYCSAARRIDPGSAEAYAIEGFIRSIANDHRAAMQKFRMAISLAPDSGEVHSLLGRACFAQIDMGLAGPMLERAAALRSDDYHSLMLAGKARRMKGQVERARADFTRAAARIEARLETNPDDLLAVVDLAGCLVHLERHEEASALLDRVHDHSDLNYHLACTFARAGYARRALDVLEAVVDNGWNRSDRLDDGRPCEIGLRDWNRRAWLDRDPDFAPIRHHRRFQRLVRGVTSH